MPLLRLALFLLTALPFAWLAAALLRRLRRGQAAAAVGLSLVLFAFLFAFHHENRYEFLDPACYRAMSAAFAAGSDLRPVRESLESVPAPLRRDMLMRPDLPSLDGVFRYEAPRRAASAEPGDTEAFRTRPCFLPALPLAASALGPLHDAFVPLVGALWCLSLLAFALSHEASAVPPVRRIATAAVLLLATFMPSWFFRGFHTDAVGSALVSLALLAVISRPFRGRLALAGFCLAFSAAFHFTMALYALPVAVFAIVRDGTWKRTLSLALGALLGCALVAAELQTAGSPYSSGGIAGFIAAAKASPAIFALLCVVALLGTLALVLLALAHAPSVRAWFCRPKVSRAGSVLLASATALAVLLPFAGKFLGVPQLAAGATSAHPAMVLPLLPLAALALCPFYADFRVFRSERLLLLFIALAGAFGLYLKGSEQVIGVSGAWGFRRILPTALLLVPVFLHGALMSRASRFLRVTVSTLALVPMFLSPQLWTGVQDAGADRIADRMAAVLSKNNLVLFDYRPRAGMFAVRSPDQRMFSLPKRNPSGLWDRCAGWMVGEAEIKSNSVALVTSYEPCTMEDGMVLDPVFASIGSVRRIHTKRLYPCMVESQDIRDTVLSACPTATGFVGQRKVFDGGPFGIRGLWKSANRGGCWSAPEGCGIVGPVPRPGHPVDVELGVEWFDGTGTNDVAHLRLVPPSGSGAPQTFDVRAGSRQIVRLHVAAPDSLSAVCPSTGLWKVEGEAVFYEARFSTGSKSSSTIP